MKKESPIEVNFVNVLTVSIVGVCGYGLLKAKEKMKRRKKLTAAQKKEINKPSKENAGAGWVSKYAQKRNGNGFDLAREREKNGE